MALVPGQTDKNICHFSVPRLAPLIRCFSSPSLAPRPCPARVVKLKTEEMERHTRSKRKVRFEEPPVATVRPRRKAAALEPVVVEETAVPGEATLVTLTRGTAARRAADEQKPLGFELWASGAHRHRAPAPAAGSDSSTGGPSAREPRGGQGEARRGGGRGRQRARGSASPPGLPRRGGGLQESPIHRPAREWRAVSAVVKRDEADVRMSGRGGEEGRALSPRTARVA